VICVSTQLIEAGIDISFECVIRDAAGLDSVFQAAGRCNRHGEFGEAKNVYVVNIKGENLDKLPDIKTGAQITMTMFGQKNTDINEYYRHYFYERKCIMDYPIKQDGVTVGSVYDLLSANERGKKAYRSRKDKFGAAPPALPSAIRSAAEEFYVIDKGRTDVIALYGGSEDLLSRYAAANKDAVAEKRGVLRELGKYSVSLYEYQKKELSRRRALDETGYPGLIVLERGFYDKERGVDLEGSPDFLCV